MRKGTRNRSQSKLMHPSEKKGEENNITTIRNRIKCLRYICLTNSQASDLRSMHVNGSGSRVIACLLTEECQVKNSRPDHTAYSVIGYCTPLWEVN